MRILILSALILAAARPAAAAVSGVPEAFQDALAARSMLGADIWARLVRIENSGARRFGRRSQYPRIEYALVFELSGILWFYTDADGTQSLSVTLGTLDRDKADPGPLFRAIDPGFASWSWVGEPAGAWALGNREPPNACFVESIAVLLRRMALGGEAGSPRLLSYYVDTPGGRLGHTVLIFSTRGGLSAVDPGISERPVSLPAALGGDPRALSSYLWGKPVSAARTLPIRFPGKAPSPGRWVAIPTPGVPAG